MSEGCETKVNIVNSEERARRGRGQWLQLGGTSRPDGAFRKLLYSEAQHSLYGGRDLSLITTALKRKKKKSKPTGCRLLYMTYEQASRGFCKVGGNGVSDLELDLEPQLALVIK